MAWLIRGVLAAVAAQIAVGWQLVPHGAMPAGLLAIAAATLTAVIIAVLTHASWPSGTLLTGPLARRAVALRRKSLAAVFQRQRDPDAAGRARPRAPSAAPAAA